MRTAQELFTIAATHMLAQNRRCQRSDGTCLYRGPDGMKCAVGVLIPDEEYKPEMDPGGFQNLIDSGLLTVDRATEFLVHRSLLIDLQSVHDKGVPPGDPDDFNATTDRWREGLEAIAKYRGLQMPETSPA